MKIFGHSKLSPASGDARTTAIRAKESRDRERAELARSLRGVFMCRTPSEGLMGQASPNNHDERRLTSRADDNVVPSAPAHRHRDWLIPLACAAVFVAEIGVAVGIVDVREIVHYDPSLDVRTETASPRALEAEPVDEESRRAPAPDAPHALQAAEPLIAAPSDPPTAMAPAADDGATLKYGETSKVAKVRRHRVSFSSPAPTANGSVPHDGNQHYRYAEDIYRPGGRPPGW